MSDNLRTRIAAVQRAHRLWRDPGMTTGKTCQCGWTSEAPITDHPEHVADVVIRELKLEVEDGECGYCRAQLPGCRYVTEWENPND